MSPPDHTPLPLSRALAEAVQQGDGAYITISELVAGIKTQALAMLLILFSLPNILPALPGTSAITGLPMVLLTAQMIFGQKVWLPKLIADRGIPRAGFLGMLEKAQPYFDSIEKLLHPRILWLSEPLAVRLISIFMFVLSVIIMLPIPFANALPALAIMAMAIGITVRDGYMILGGIAVAIGGLATMVLVSWGIIVVVLATFGP